MGRYTGPKNRLARREGQNLGLKFDSLKLEKRLNVPPGQHGQKRRRGRLSDFGKRLREKQKLKRIYGLTERQFKRYYDLATKQAEATGEKLLELLEQRLDNVVYRLGFSPTRAAARQLVSHGHVVVDERRVDVPSFRVGLGQVVSLSAKALEIPAIKKVMTERKYSPPSWLERQGSLGKVVTLPKREEAEQNVDEQLVVEYYSK